MLPERDASPTQSWDRHNVNQVRVPRRERPAAHFFSLNDDISGGAITSVALEVLFSLRFVKISLRSTGGIIAVHVSSFRGDGTDNSVVRAAKPSEDQTRA